MSAPVDQGSAWKYAHRFPDLAAASRHLIRPRREILVENDNWRPMAENPHAGAKAVYEAMLYTDRAVAGEQGSSHEQLGWLRLRYPDRLDWEAVAMHVVRTVLDVHAHGVRLQYAADLGCVAGEPIASANNMRATERLHLIVDLVRMNKVLVQQMMDDVHMVEEIVVAPRQHHERSLRGQPATLQSGRGNKVAVGVGAGQVGAERVQAAEKAQAVPIFNPEAEDNFYSSLFGGEQQGLADALGGIARSEQERKAERNAERKRKRPWEEME